MSSSSQRKRKADETNLESIESQLPIKQRKLINTLETLEEEDYNCNISIHDSYLFILQTYYYQQIHPLTSKICQNISQYCSSKDHNDYVIITRVFTACFDQYITLKHKLLYDTNKETAIKIGKKMFFEEMNDCWRDGIQFDVDDDDDVETFNLSKMHTYDADYYRDLWKYSLSGSGEHESLGGPVLLQIFEYDSNNKHCIHSDPIYQLPVDSDHNDKDEDGDKTMLNLDTQILDEQDVCDFNLNIPVQELYFFMLQNYFYQQIHPLNLEICSNISEYCISRDVHNYVIMIRVFELIEEICCNVKHKFLYNTTKQKAIEIGKKLYFDEISNVFDGNVELYFKNDEEIADDVEFKFEKVAKYSCEYYEDLWGKTDGSEHQCVHPGGAATLQIFEYNSSDKTVIFYLPYDAENLYKEDIDEDDEDDEGE